MILRKLSPFLNHVFNLSGRSIAFLSFIVFYLCAAQYCRVKNYRDPTSFFFDPQRAYQPGYSAVRRREADAFIESAATMMPFNKTAPSLNSAPARFCIGMASVAREMADYFSTAVGSLLAGLTPSERQGIHLVLFIAHTDPLTHPAYSLPWVANVADRVLTYDLPEEQLQHIRQLESDRGLFREKGLFDYTYLLKACRAVEGMAYIVMMKDDVIALDGWYHRTREALEVAKRKSYLRGSSNFLYLRLFYTEEFLGWNSEEWPIYLLWSLITVSTCTLSLLALRYIHPLFQKTILSTPTITLISLGYIPLCILLLFACGRVSMLSLPAGVNLMPQFGCCSQSLVFPHSRAGELIEWYESKRMGFVDVLTEEFADRDDTTREGKGNGRGEELRWALTPSVMQHVGRKSSKGDDFGKGAKWQRSVAEKLWNFEFERNQVVRLGEEHARFGGRV